MEKDYLYLLPDGINTVETMREGCEQLSKQKGHPFSSKSFRLLVKKGIVLKINRGTNGIILKSDASKETTLSTSQLIDGGR